MSAHLTVFVVRRYWLRLLTFPVLCFLACLPCLVLAIWFERATRSNDLILSQLLSHHRMHKQKTEALKINKTGDFLWHQFEVIARVFRHGIRVSSVDWHSTVLTVRGEARSMPIFISDWNDWLSQNKGQSQHLISYQLKGHPFFKVTVSPPDEGVK